MLNGLYAISQLYFNDISIWLPRCQFYADLIYDATGGAAYNVIGFIDGTLRQIARPTYSQNKPSPVMKDIME
jgi:hypothetical protein